MPHFRHAVAADAQGIGLLHAESWRSAYRGFYRQEFLDGDVMANRLAVWRERLASGRDDQFVMVAMDGDRLTGFICAYGGDSSTWGSLIDNLHIAPKLKGTGIGRSLMAHAARWLGVCYADVGVYLWVIEANASARRFYDALGGRNAEVAEKRHTDGTVLRTCRYSWPSPAAIAARIASARP